MTPEEPQKTGQEVSFSRALQDKYERLRCIILEAGSAAIAFSGGVDSALLLRVCTDLLGEKEMSMFWEGNLRQEIVSRFKSLGYSYVTLDLEGYRAGSMNEPLTLEQIANGTGLKGH
jgi:PP-loop superfamily ATP-utilizing enzyme